MMLRVELIKAGHEDFAKHWETLANSCLGSPVYCDSNSSYYQTVSDQTVIKNFDCIALLDGQPTAGVRLNLAQGAKSRVLDYYGNPGCFLALTATPNNNLAFSAISKSLVEDGLRAAISSPDVEIVLNMSAEWTEEPTKAIDLILKNSSKLRPAFSRYLDLRAVFSADQPIPLPRWPKSVREALKIAESSGIGCTAMDESSGKAETEQAFLELKALHFSSAGRLTRAEASWGLQLQNIKDGHAFLVDAKLEGKTIGVSYFLRCGKSSYYGVSASHLGHRNLSIGHVIMVEAIDFARRSGLNTFWVGNQFSRGTGEASEKEFQIEKFKSYFGSNLSLGILATRDPHHS